MNYNRGNMNVFFHIELHTYKYVLFIELILFKSILYSY